MHSSDSSSSVHLHGLLEGVQRHEPPASPRRPARRFAPARTAFGRRSGDDPQLPEIQEAPGRNSVITRERLYRRSLAVADGFAAGLSLVLATTVLGDDRIKLGDPRGGADRDPHQQGRRALRARRARARRSTLDEAPVLFQLAALFTLVSWLLAT